MWNDPFSGKIFTRTSDLDIDHVVPLYWAHAHGGANWPLEKKEEFANDMRNLLAVDNELNQRKGARGPSEWMPPNQSFRCDYLRIWIDVMKIYPGLAFTSSEQRIVNGQLKTCEIKVGAYL